MCSLYRNPDLNDWIFDCLLASMAAVQAEDDLASFLFVGDLNGHHQEWLGSMSTTHHGVAAFDFAISWLSAQPMHVVEHDLLMTDVPDLVQVAVMAPIGNSDHSSLSAVISMAYAVPNLCVSTSVFLEHQVNLNTVCFANQGYVPTKVIRVRNKDKPWHDDQCRHAFSLKQEVHLRWTCDCSRVNWEEFVHYQVRANETYSEANCQFSDRNRDVLMNVQSPHTWQSTLKSAVFDSSSSLPPLISEGGVLVCESVGKVDLLYDHFDSKQSMEGVDLQLTCHPSPSLTTFTFRSSEVRCFLLDLDPYDPLGMFALFLKRTADVMNLWPPILV